MNAPEKIWVWGYAPGGVHGWIDADGEPPRTKEVGYTRTDLAQAMVAAAYDVAGDAAADAYDAMDVPSGSDVSGFVRSLTPADARAALDARDKRVREDALREAAAICVAARDKRNKQRNDYPDESRDVQQRWMAGALQSQYNADAILDAIDQTPEDTQDVYAAVGLLRALASERNDLRAENERLRDALTKCARIMENRQPDKMPDGVYMARAALNAKPHPVEAPDGVTPR